MAIGWLQGDDAAVRAHFTEVERVPKALEVTECVSLPDHSLASLQGNARCQVSSLLLCVSRVAMGVKGRAAWGCHGRGRER